LQPAQRTGRHCHPGGVIGYVVEGEITLQIDGQSATTLRAGSVFHVPSGVTIARFDNASNTETAVFIAFYPLADDQPLISMLD
jgi:quercetin dioxygenase-like cupin family protein